MIVVLPALAQLVLVLMLGQGLPFGSATSSFLGQDPSCATVEVDSAPAARSHSECAAVLLSITLVASTESCATDAELFLVVEEPPRDVKTYGGMNNSANLEGKEITWWLPEITEGSPLTMEFVIDLCDYCDKYGGQEFNPIDSFLYTDAEGNEPNERSDAFKMELPCDGLHGGAITSIVATPVPTPSPTNAPTPFPTKLPTLSPPKVPSPPPTYAPTPPLTKAPTPSLTKAPIPSPTKAPIHPPTKAPTPPPTKAPTPPPTKAPTPSPTKAPTPPPTKAPTQPPTKAPTLSPTKVPSPPPTYAPTPPLTKAPTPSPTKAPNPSPTKAPIQPPTKAPTPPPTKAPTASPTKAPTASPTKAPTPPLTKAPTPPPTKAPTRPPTKAPTPSPTKAPTPPPTKAPTPSPTKSPTLSPTKAPTPPPTKAPTPSPTKAPTASPTKAPTPSPTKAPTPSPTKAPTSSPTKAPTPSPTKAPTPSPTQAPTLSPTKAPTPPPTGAPTPSPITVPTLAPTTMAPSAAAMMLPEVSTQSPTLTPYGDSMAFSMSPTSTSTASPTWSTGDYSRGITLQIQSFFEARRRAQGVAQPGGERRSLAIVYQEDAEDYDLAMVDVCAAVVGVGKERVMSVSTDFGPEGPTINDSARRALQTTSSGTSSVSTSMTQAASATTASQLAPITTCEVDLSSGGNTRSMTAAALVDKLFMPENFVLLLDENRFGPVNAAVSSSECPNETCPAGDGPYASVFPLTETESHRTVMETLESDEGSLLGFIVLAVALLLLVCCSWLVFCLCCTGSRQKPRPQKPRQSIEDRYSVQNSSGSGPSPLSEEFSTSPSTSSGKRITPPRISTDRPAKDAVVEPSSPGEAQWRRMFGLSPAREPSYRSAPISPRFTNSDSSGSGIGSRTNSTRQGANPFFTTADDFKHRKRVVIRVDSVGGNSGGSGQSSSQSISRGSSQTISRGSSQTISRGSSQTISRGSSRTISRGSSRTISRGSSRTISRGSSQSISRSGSSGSSEVDAVALQPVVSPSSGSKTEEKRQLEVSDEVRSRELRVNDPFVREYASSVNGETKASRKSPREELNRLRETLNRPTKGAPQSLNSTSPTATMSSKSRSRSLSSGPKVGSLSGPIHEIHENDVEVDEGGKDSLQRNAGKQQSKALGGTVEEESGSRDTDRLESSNFGKASLNECNKTPPPSVVKRWRQPASPSGRSDLSTSTYGSNVSEATTIYNGQTRPPILSAGTAAVTAGIPSSTSRPGSIFVSRPGATSVNESEGARTPTNRPEATPEEEAVGAPRAGHSNPPDDAAPANVSSFRSSSNVGRVGGDKNGRRDSNGEPPSMPPLPPNVNQLAKKEVERRSRPATDAAVTAKAATLSGERSGSGLEEEHQVEEIRSAAVLTSPSRRATPLGGVLSNFACLAVDDEESPSAAEASGERRRGEKLTAHFSRTASTLPRSRAPGSRLPRIVDGDMKKDEDPLAQGELTVDAPSAFPPAAGKNCSVGVGSMSATGHQTLDKVLTIFRGRVITSELQPVAEGEDEDRVVTDSETESEISSRASSFSGVEGPRRASRDSALGRARQIAAIPPPSSGSLGLFVTPLEAVAEVPDEVKGRYSPHPPPYPDISESSQDGWLSGDRPKTSLALVIPSPSVRPTTSDRMTSESNATEGTKVLVGDGTGKTFKKVGECVASGPVENARPMMDGGGIKDQVVEEKGNSRGDSVKGKNSAAADDMPIVKKSTQKWAPQPSLSLPPPVKRPTEQVPDAEQSPGFSLISALSTFLWKKENVSRGSPSNAARVPGEHGVDVVAERDDEMGPDEGKMVSPSQSLKDWAESKVEAPPKHALDGGSSEVSVDTALGSKGQDGNTCEVADGQPSRWPHSDLPSLALDDGIMAGPADSPFSRATMNLQSPEPKPPTPPVASMPTLPKPPSSTFVKGVNLPPLARDVDVPSKSPGDSPKYDRDAIVKSMSLATREAEEYEESDIPTPRKEAWPSVRRAAARIESALGDASGNGSGKEHGGGGREEDEPCVGGGEGRANRVHGDTRRTSSSGNYYRYHDRK